MRRAAVWLALGFLALSVPVALAFSQSGKAVWYVGKPDRETRMTAAHLTLRFGTWVRVTHARTGRSVVVKVNDRGPFNGKGRIIDLSRAAAHALGIIDEGVAPVRITTVPRP